MAGVNAPLIDDVGSFPLPEYISPRLFKLYYWDIFDLLIGGRPIQKISKNKGLNLNVLKPIRDSFRDKIGTGLDIINYPQFMDMYRQFLKPLKEYETDDEPHLIKNEGARMIEIDILKQWAKEQYEQNPDKYRFPIKLKVCVTGPLELYFKEVGFEIYSDMALNFSKTVNAFLKNSIIDTPYIKTTTVAIDEPSLGFVTITNADDDELIKIYDRSVEHLGKGIDIQIHLHSLNQFKIPLQTENIGILTCEFASDHQNIIDKAYLDQYDKFIRVGISRTNINAIMASLMDRGVSYDELNTLDGMRLLIDSEDRIRENLKIATEHYGDRLKYVGPDCGLSAWAPPQIATELLSRTVKVVREYFT